MTEDKIDISICPMANGDWTAIRSNYEQYGYGETPQKALDDLLCKGKKEKYTLKWKKYDWTAIRSNYEQYGYGEMPQKALDDLLCKEKKEKYTLKWKKYDGSYSNLYEAAIDKCVFHIRNDVCLIPYYKSLGLTYCLSLSYDSDPYHLIFMGTLEECRERAQEIINYGIDGE